MRLTAILLVPFVARKNCTLSNTTSSQIKSTFQYLSICEYVCQGFHVNCFFGRNCYAIKMSYMKWRIKWDKCVFIIVPHRADLKSFIPRDNKHEKNAPIRREQFTFIQILILIFLNSRIYFLLQISTKLFVLIKYGVVANIL